ncbi:MAG: rhodanese-like domain-containing protein [Rubrivivax sp.]|nr:rhodanese-like domain-containing protein [Rubrivivax sp.]
MTFLIENWMLILLALLSGGMLLAPQLRPTGKAIGTAEAVRLINREKGVLIDVCEPAEFAAGHATGARNVPLATLETTKDLPSNKALPLIVMCASGARSRRAAAVLRKLGYENVHPVAGGNGAWREANLPVEKKAA